MLERDHRVLELCGAEVGVAGCKGFAGGFDGAHIPDFGEPLMREVYAESMREAEALDAALRAIALCPFRIALLHYAPITATLEGERTDIWPFLGTDRLAAPLREHHPDLVLHGHAHAGTFAGALGEVPVYNVSRPRAGRGLLGVRDDRRPPDAVRGALSGRISRACRNPGAPVRRARMMGRTGRPAKTRRSQCASW